MELDPDPWLRGPPTHSKSYYFVITVNQTQSRWQKMDKKIDNETGFRELGFVVASLFLHGQVSACTGVSQKQGPSIHHSHSIVHQIAEGTKRVFLT